MSGDVTEDPVGLLGLRVTDPELSRFIPGFESLPQPEHVEVESYYSFLAAGISLLTDPNQVIRAVFLYQEGHDGFAGYVGPLPLRLDMTLRQDDVRARCGTPAFERPAGDVPLLGRKGPSERYDFPSFSVHLEYSEHTGQVLVVTLMTHSSVPRSILFH